MSNEPDQTSNDNAGNQYDHPNQDVVGTDIVSGEGNEPEPVDPDEPIDPDAEPEPDPDPPDDPVT